MGVPQCNVEVGEVDVVQERVDMTQVTRRQVDLLDKILTATGRPEKLRELQEQGPPGPNRLVHARDTRDPSKARITRTPSDPEDTDAPTGASASVEADTDKQ